MSYNYTGELAEMHDQTNTAVGEEHSRFEITDAVQTVDSHNREEHRLARQEMAQLKDGLKQLSEEIKIRDAVHRGLLFEFTKVSSPKKQMMLKERTNEVRVSATMFALETCTEPCR